MTGRVWRACLENLVGIVAMYTVYWITGLAGRVGEELTRHRFPGYWMIFCPTLFVGLVALALVPIRQKRLAKTMLAGVLIGFGASTASLLISVTYNFGASGLFRQLGFLGVFVVYSSVAFLALGWLFGGFSAGISYCLQKYAAGHSPLPDEGTPRPTGPEDAPRAALR